MAEQESVATFKFANQPKLFGKWDYDEQINASKIILQFRHQNHVCLFPILLDVIYICVITIKERSLEKLNAPQLKDWLVHLWFMIEIQEKQSRLQQQLDMYLKQCIYLLTGKNPLESYHQLFKEVELEKILQKQEQVVLPNNKQLILHLLKELMKLFIIQLKKLERSFFFVFKIRNNQQLLMIKSINTYHNMARLKNNYNQYVQILIFEKIKFGKSFGSQKQRNYIKLNKVMLQQNFEF